MDSKNEAVAKLREAEKELMAQLSGVQGALSVLDESPRVSPGKKRGRKSMSPAERKKTSERMKKYWAKRKRAVGKTTGKAVGKSAKLVGKAATGTVKRTGKVAGKLAKTAAKTVAKTAGKVAGKVVK